MAVKLNLLPQELAVDKNLARLSRTLRTLLIVLLVIFLVFAIGVSAFFLISSLQLRNLTAREEALTAQIKDREVTEQKIVLLKDRIGKIKVAESFESSLGELEGVNPLVSTLSEDSSVSELAVDPKKTDVSVIFRSSAGLGGFFKNLSQSEIFRSIVLTSFGFNPSSGYLVSIRLMSK